MNFDNGYYLVCFVAGCALAAVAPDPWLVGIGFITAIGAYLAWLTQP